MIEQGLVALVTASAPVVALAPEGGFLAQLPENQPLPSWTFSFVTEAPLYTLQGREPLTMRRLQIDCYGATPAEAIALAAAINRVLDGYRGTLADPDATGVRGIFKSNQIDFFDDGARSYRRSLEYTVWFDDQIS
jgi:hypothetical protein